MTENYNQSKTELFATADEQKKAEEKNLANFISFNESIE